MTSRIAPLAFVLATSFGNYGPRRGYYRRYRDDLKPYDILAVGARVPRGLNVAFNEVPTEIVPEVGPRVALFPGIGFFGRGGLGARLNR